MFVAIALRSYISLKCVCEVLCSIRVSLSRLTGFHSISFHHIVLFVTRILCYLQVAVKNIAAWTRNWRFKLNEGNSTLISFSVRNNTKICQCGILAEYKKSQIYRNEIRCQNQIHRARENRTMKNLKYKIENLLGRKTKLWIQNKIRIYNRNIKNLFGGTV